MKKSPIILATILSAAAPLHLSADLYWDRNLDAAGAGSIPHGVWDTTTDNWNTDPSGAALPGVWTSGETAFFSAGNDATGAYTVTIAGTQTATGINIEDGTVIFPSGTAAVGSGVITVNPGATLSINNVGRLSGSAGSKLTLNGGTIMQTNPSITAGSFIPATMDLEIGAAGGTVNYTSSGVGFVSIYGGTSGTITGTGTLTKTGPNEFRYQGLGLPNTTYSKLVVNQGLFRLGFNQSIQDERGFGAVPAVFTPDAITLSGGGSIATSFTAANSVLHVNRGITLGAGGGSLLGPITVQGAITGSGSLTATLSTVALTGASDYTGSTTVASGTILALGSATVASGSILSTAAVNVNNGTLSLVNTIGNVDRVGDTTPVTLSNGIISVTHNPNVNTTEAIGLLTLDSGRNVVSVSSAAGRVTTLMPTSLSRGTQNATALIRGTSLGQTVATNVARIILGDAGASLSFVGTNTLDNAATNDATQAVRIVPYLFGDTSSAGTGNGFVTYDTTLGLRVLTAAQSTPLTSTYTTAANPDNARVTSDLTLTDVSPVTVNSLLFVGTAASTLSSTTSNPLTVNSGAVATTGAFDYTIDGSFSGLALGNGEGVITVTGNTLTIGTPISVTNNGGLNKAGAGTLNLTVPNAYTGPTTISGGIVQVNNSGALGTNSIFINGTRLAITDGVTIGNAITIGANAGVAGRGLIEPVSGIATIAGPLAINNNAVAGGHFAAPGGATLIVAGTITAPPSVTVTSRLGNVILSGGGTGYSRLQIQAETVSIGADNGIATTAIVDVASGPAFTPVIGATLDLNGFNQTLAGLARTSTTDGRHAIVTNNIFGTPVTLTLNVTGEVAFAGTAAAATTTGDAIITGDLSLVKTGAGRQSLSGAGGNTYLGSTTINEGILKLLKSGNTDSIPGGNTVTIGTDGTLQLGADSQINDGVTDFVIDGGTFDLDAFIEGITPAVKITDGTITGTSAGFLLARGGFIANGTNTISKSISVRSDVDSGNFDIVSGTTTVSGVIQNDDFSGQGITKLGEGTLVLSATNTYTGQTTVIEGTVEFAASQTLTGLTITENAVVVISEQAAPAPAAQSDNAGQLVDAVQAVPEPGAFSLLTIGLLSVLGRRRRQV